MRPVQRSTLTESRELRPNVFKRTPFAKSSIHRICRAQLRGAAVAISSHPTGQRSVPCRHRRPDVPSLLESPPPICPPPSLDISAHAAPHLRPSAPTFPNRDTGSHFAADRTQIGRTHRGPHIFAETHRPSGSPGRDLPARNRAHRGGRHTGLVPGGRDLAADADGCANETCLETVSCVICHASAHGRRIRLIDH
jgi:hypothetical protein